MSLRCSSFLISSNRSTHSFFRKERIPVKPSCFSRFLQESTGNRASWSREQVLPKKETSVADDPVFGVRSEINVCRNLKAEVRFKTSNCVSVFDPRFFLELGSNCEL